MALTKVIGAGIGTVTNQFSDANMSAGSVIQFQSSVNQNPGNISFNGTSNSNYLYGANRPSRTYSLARTVTITPASTSSILYCVGTVGWTAMANSATMGHGQIITRNDDGSGGALSDTIDNADYPWYQHSNYISIGSYFPAEVVVGIFSPSSTSQQTIKLRPYLYVEASGGTVTGIYQSSSLFVMEIAG
jgi:hypothetical protein